MLFNPFGPVESLRLLPHKNCGFVNFYHIEHAIVAKRILNGQMLDGMCLRTGFAKAPPEFRPDGTMEAYAPDPYGGVTVDISAFPALPMLPMLPMFGGGENPIMSTFAATVMPSPVFSPLDFPAVGDVAPPVKTAMLDPVSVTKLSFSVSPSEAASDHSIADHLPTPTTPPEEGTLFFNEPKLTIVVVFKEDIPILRHMVGVDVAYGNESSPHRVLHKIDQHYLRECRKRLEHGTVTPKEFETIFEHLLPQLVELSTDVFGNTVVQKLIERGSDAQRLKMLERCADQLAPMGVHKNGTWVVQKMVDCAKTTTQIQFLLSHMKPYTPALLMDPFGNYVIQGCLRLGPYRNQFIFDAMQQRCLQVAQGKFGARAMRACLESTQATKKQQVLFLLRHTY
jgi:protein JSN1